MLCICHVSIFECFVYSVSLTFYIVTLYSSFCKPVVWGQSYMYCVLEFCVFLICIQYILMLSFSHTYHIVDPCCHCVFLQWLWSCCYVRSLVYKQPLSPFLTISYNPWRGNPAMIQCTEISSQCFILKQAICALLSLFLFSQQSFERNNIWRFFLNTSLFDQALWGMSLMGIKGRQILVQASLVCMKVPVQPEHNRLFFFFSFLNFVCYVHEKAWCFLFFFNSTSCFNHVIHPLVRL